MDIQLVIYNQLQAFILVILIYIFVSDNDKGV